MLEMSALNVDELRRLTKNEWADLNHYVIEGGGAILYALVFVLEAYISSI